MRLGALARVCDEPHAAPLVPLAPAATSPPEEEVTVAAAARVGTPSRLAAEGEEDRDKSEGEGEGEDEVEPDPEVPEAAPTPAAPSAAPSSRHRGVSWNKCRRRWQATIRTDKKLAHLGFFVDEERAAERWGRAKEAKLAGRPVKPPPAARPGAIVSAYRGVTRNKRRQKWQAQISVKGVTMFLGYFDDEGNAAAAYQAAVWAKQKGFGGSAVGRLLAKRLTERQARRAEEGQHRRKLTEQQARRRARRAEEEQRRRERAERLTRNAKRRQQKGGQVAVLPACDGRFHCGACWAARERDLRRPPFVRSERRQLRHHIRRACEYTDGVAKSFRGRVMAPDGCRRHYALCVCGLARCAALAEAWVRHPSAADWQSALREAAV